MSRQPVVANPLNPIPPTGPAGGSLAGTYPNPSIAANAVGAAEIAADSVGSSEIAPGAVTVTELANGAVILSKVDASLIDPAPGNAGLRTLGTGPNQALPGNTLLSPASRGTLAARPAANTKPVGYLYETSDGWQDLWMGDGAGTGVGGSGTGWTLIASKNEMVLTLAGVASGTFTGLNGDVDEAYDLTLDVDIAGTAGMSVGARPNGDGTAGQYQRMGTTYLGGAPTVANVEATGTILTAIITGVAPSRIGGQMRFGARTGARRTGSALFGADGAAASRGAYSGLVSWLNTATNITTLDVVSTGAGGTMTGKAILRRLVTP